MTTTTSIIPSIAPAGVDQLHWESMTKTISSLVVVIRTDYPVQFSKVFPTDAMIKAYKTRLRDLLIDYRTSDVVAGFAAANTNNSVPGVKEIVAEVKAAAKTRRKKEETDRIIEAAIANKPTITCDPVKMLANAKEGIDISAPDNETKKRFAEKLLMHEQLIAADASTGRVRRVSFNPSVHKCGFSGCHEFGSVSPSTKGAGEAGFYCVTHYRLT